MTIIDAMQNDLPRVHRIPHPRPSASLAPAQKKPTDGFLLEVRALTPTWEDRRPAISTAASAHALASDLGPVVRSAACSSDVHVRMPLTIGMEETS